MSLSRERYCHLLTFSGHLHYLLFIIIVMSHINCTRACDLTGNQIGVAGATQLADALQRNSTLTDLDLQCKHDMICIVVCLHLQYN